MGWLATALSVAFGSSTPTNPPPTPLNQTVVIPASTSSTTSPGNTTINFNLYNNLSANPTSNASATSDAAATAQNKNDNTNTAYVINTLTDNAQHAKDWLKQYRTRLLLTSAASSYACLYWYLAATYYAIDHSFWCNWKKHLTSQELYEQSFDDQIKKELSKKLAQDIFNHHINPRDPTNTISPLTDFIRTIEVETTKINRYILVSQLALKLRLSYLLPVNPEKIERAKECRARLKFINSLFVSWAASYNFNKF